MNSRSKYGKGWLPELLDVRDLRPDDEQVEALLSRTEARAALARGPRSLGAAARRARRTPARKKPAAVDLRKWCSPIEDQGPIGSCTAHAAAGLVEFFERKATGRHVDASRLFIYKATRRLMNVTGDTGAYLRTAMKALVMVGAPPERYWRYDVADFEVEPPSFIYALAANYKAVKYFRLDVRGGSATQALARIKDFLVAGYPSMFGFTTYPSMDDAEGGKIPFPEGDEREDGGHAVMAVGYDDGMKVGKEKGALLIRNSWGTGWGQKGYGYLPYAYVESGLADDFWSIQSQTWVDTRNF